MTDCGFRGNAGSSSPAIKLRIYFWNPSLLLEAAWTIFAAALWKSGPEFDILPPSVEELGVSPLLWEQLSRANRVRFCPSAFRVAVPLQLIDAFLPMTLRLKQASCVSLLSAIRSLRRACTVYSASNKPVVSHSYPQSAAFAALALYSPSSGVQSRARTHVHRGARTHLGRDIVTS